MYHLTCTPSSLLHTSVPHLRPTLSRLRPTLSHLSIPPSHTATCRINNNYDFVTEVASRGTCAELLPMDQLRQEAVKGTIFHGLVRRERRGEGNGEEGVVNAFEGEGSQGGSGDRRP